MVNRPSLVFTQVGAHTLSVNELSCSREAVAFAASEVFSWVNNREDGLHCLINTY